MTVAEYSRIKMQRAEIISQNRSRRFKGLEPLPVPELPEAPTCLVAYEADGTYLGRINDISEAPKGSIVKTETALY